MVICDISSVVGQGQGSRPVREDVPDGRSSAFRLHRALGLVGGRRDSPKEALGEFPALVLGHLGDLMAAGEGGVVQGRRRDQLGSGDGSRLDGGVDGCRLDRPDEEVPVFWLENQFGFTELERVFGIGVIRLTSISIVVVNDAGFSTVVPLLALVVGLSPTMTDPVAAGSAARETRRREQGAPS